MTAVGDILLTPMIERALIIGIGNAYRRDDGVGIAVAAELNRIAIPGVRVIEARGDGTALIDAWKDSGHVVLVDATSSGAAPGTIHRIEAATQSLPVNFSHHSTHSVNLAEAIELARVLNRLPERLIVLGIEGEDFRRGTELSPAVQSAAASVVQMICEELHARRHVDDRIAENG